MLKNSQLKTQHITSVFEIKDCDCYFLDMYGLLWNGEAFYEGTLEFLKSLKALGKRIILLSNATVLKDPFVESQKKKGLIQGEHFDDVITSGEAFHHAIKEGFFEEIIQKEDYSFYVLGTPNAPLFETVSSHMTDDLSKADVVYLSGFGATIPEDGERVFKEYALILNEVLKNNLPVICANPDLTFISHGKQVLVQGSLGKYYEMMGGKVYWYGKPYPYIFEYALQVTKADPKKTLMVGDTVETDVLGGAKAGLKTLLVTKTGITGDLLKQGATLEFLYKKNGVIPTYTTNQFSKLTITE